MSRTFRKLTGRDGLILREDFCGTAAISLAWARSKRSREAYGVDLDAQTLGWAREHRVHPGREPKVRERVHLVHGNVLDVQTPRRTSPARHEFQLLGIQEAGRASGLFPPRMAGTQAGRGIVFDLYGGTEATIESEFDKDIDGEFVYRWEQAEYRPMTNEQVCHIHFLFSDGPSLKPAFSYDWRLWTAPEIREVLEEAGFPQRALLLAKD